MLIVAFLFLSISSLNIVSAQAAAIQSPKIINEKGRLIIVLPEKMKTAISKFNPDFAIWQVEDYAPSIARSSREIAESLRDKGRWIAPFAVIVDVNRDGVPDIILDGHDKQKDLLIGVISNKGDYRVISIKEYELSVPRKIKNFFEGKAEFGLKSCLAAGNGGRIVFITIYPQQSDAKGELLNDGGMTEYVYKNGKFVGSTQIP